VDDFLATIQRCEISKEKEDKWERNGRSAKMYIVKEVYKILSDGVVGHSEEVFQRLWKMKDQPSSILCS